MTVSVLCLFFTVPWAGLQCVIMAFPGHTHLFLYLKPTGMCRNTTFVEMAISSRQNNRKFNILTRFPLKVSSNSLVWKQRINCH